MNKKFTKEGDVVFISDASAIPDLHQYNHQLQDNRTIIFNNDVDATILENVILPLLDLEKDDSQEPVTLILNSCGGSVSDGLMLCPVIDNYKKPLIVIVPGYALSMGAVILCAGAHNPNVTKKCYPFAYALFHAGSTSIAGDTAAVDDTIDFNRGIDKKIKDYVCHNTAITPEEYDKHYRHQWFLTSEEMLKYGLVNEIIGGGEI